MTNAVSGMKGSLWAYTSDVPASMKKIAELSDLKLKIEGKDIDTSNVDDAGWGSSITGARSWSVTLSNNLIMSDDAYGLHKDALINGTELYVYILQDGEPNSTPSGWKGKCGVASGDITLAGPNTQQKADWTLKGRGALAAATT